MIKGDDGKFEYMGSRYRHFTTPNGMLMADRSKFAANHS
jgi:hypothetical protein